MVSVFAIPSYVLVAAGIIAVIALLLVVLFWVVRRWFIRPLHRLSQDIERLKEGEQPPSPHGHIGIAPEEITESGAPAGPQSIPVNLSALSARLEQDRFQDDVQEMGRLEHDQTKISFGEAKLLMVQVEQSQALASLTRKIWAYTDQDMILRTALEEVGRMLHASSGMIQLEDLIDGASDLPRQRSTQLPINRMGS